MLEPNLADRAAFALQQALAWGQAHPWLAVAVAVVALLGVVAGIAEIAVWQRRREILRALDDSTRGRIINERRLGWHGVRVQLTPVPEPFATLSIEWTVAGGSWLGLLPALAGVRRQRLAFYGALARRPAAEVVWERGRTPERALARSPGSGLWTAHRLEYLSGAYAVHGANTAALEHAFVDLQARFGPYLRRVVLQANTSPQFVIVLVVNGMNREEIPALVTTVRALARAALIA